MPKKPWVFPPEKNQRRLRFFRFSQEEQLCAEEQRSLEAAQTAEADRLALEEAGRLAEALAKALEAGGAGRGGEIVRRVEGFLWGYWCWAMCARLESRVQQSPQKILRCV